MTEAEVLEVMDSIGAGAGLPSRATVTAPEVRHQGISRAEYWIRAGALSNTDVAAHTERWAKAHPEHRPIAFYDDGMPYPLPEGYGYIVPAELPASLRPRASAQARARDRALGSLWMATVAPPAALSGPVDDLASEVATDAYLEIKDKFLADAPTLSQAVVDAASGPVKSMVEDLLNDANTQAMLGEQHQQVEADVRNGILPVVVAGVVLTLLGTYVIVKFVR